MPTAGLSVATLVVASSLAGCGTIGISKEFSDSRTETGPVSAISLTGGSSELAITRSSSASEVTIERDVDYQHDKPDDRYDELDGEVLRLDGDCGDDCVIDYTVTVPDAVDVTVDVGSGDVLLVGLGDADIRTGSGDITVMRPTGSVGAEAGSGEISITDADGPVTAETGSGDVEVELATANDVTARASSGDLELTVPAGSSYRVDADTGSGDETVTMPSDELGDHHLDISTGSGDLSVTED